jgi:uncharacterized membrane protein YfcA
VTQALLALPLGAAIGLLLGLVGGGGSMLAVPLLVYALGEDVRRATTTSLVVVGATALAGALGHARRGRVRVGVALTFGATGAVGAIAGTALNRLASGTTILVLFALLLLAAAAAMWHGRRARPAGHVVVHGGPKVALAGLAVGVLTGFFGVGGGFLIVPALAVVLGLAMPVCVGTSLLAIALVSAGALAAHLSTGGLDWDVAATFTAGGAAGAVAGARLVGHVQARRLEQGFAALTAAVGVFLLAKNLSTIG